MCCRYFALPIDTPESREDFDDIRWYLCHEDISVFVEDGDWYLNVKNKCRHLSEKDYRCLIYDHRPTICRKYKHSDCDFVEDGDWYLNVKNKCRHLSEKDYRCLIYDHRPTICRKYKHADCDFIEGDYDYELHFTNDQEMEEYIKVKFDNNVTEKRKIRHSKGHKA